MVVGGNTHVEAMLSQFVFPNNYIVSIIFVKPCFCQPPKHSPKYNNSRVANIILPIIYLFILLFLCLCIGIEEYIN